MKGNGLTIFLPDRRKAPCCSRVREQQLDVLKPHRGRNWTFSVHLAERKQIVKIDAY